MEAEPEKVMSIFPASGSCTVIKGFPAVTGGSNKPSSAVLDAGSQLSMATPFGTAILRQFRPGRYQALIGSGFAPSQTPVGTYSISGGGGRDVEAFNASLKVSGGLHWENKATFVSVDRSQPMTITWSGGPEAGHVLFGGLVGARQQRFFFAFRISRGRFDHRAGSRPVGDAAERGQQGVFVPQPASLRDAVCSYRARRFVFCELQ